MASKTPQTRLIRVASVLQYVIERMDELMHAFILRGCFGVQLFSKVPRIDPGLERWLNRDGELSAQSVSYTIRRIDTS